MTIASAKPAGQRRVSCGVIVTDGHALLLGRAARSPRWDIPKGIAEAGENLLDAAVRELKEETGLVAPPASLAGLGVHAYLRDKDLALFAWRVAEMPAPALLHCASLIDRPGYGKIPELDRFGIFPFEAAFAKMGKNLARVLQGVLPLIGE